MVVTREPLPTRVEATPELPAEYGLALDAGLAALSLELSARTRAAIDGHVRLLLAWTNAINLTGIRDPGAIAIAHVIDSLSAVAAPPRARHRPVHRPRLRRRISGDPGGRGAAGRSGLLIEPVGKKARFLTTTIDATGLLTDRRGGAGPCRGPCRRTHGIAVVAGRHRSRGREPRRPRRALGAVARARRDPRRLEAGRPRGRDRHGGAGTRGGRRRHASRFARWTCPA